jgi:gas vesicle protein
MNKNKGNIVKGIVAGAVVGATTAMVVEPMVNKNHAKKKSRSAHYFKSMGGNVGNMVDSVISKMK